VHFKTILSKLVYIATGKSIEGNRTKQGWMQKKKELRWSRSNRKNWWRYLK